MNDLQKDMFTGAMLVVGLVGFISGEFIMSSALFASATVVSTISRATSGSSKQF
ncbi:MAG: hypothetical protein HOP34_03600 [Methylococcaceae bacterium]|nr:hypothetical protein [Methylococcaceae bacterium]